MRAVIRYKMDRMSVATRQKTIEVTKNHETTANKYKAIKVII